MKKYKLLLPVLAAILLLIPLVSACGGETTVTTTATTTTTATATATTTTTVEPAKPEGTFIFGAESLQAEGFIPWKTFLADSVVWCAVYDGLGIRTPSKKLLPSAAESWEWSDNYTKLTIHIRPGIQFQNGWGELTAEDVKFMMERSNAEDSSSSAQTYLDIVESIDIIDPYTMVIHQSESNVDWAEFYAFDPNWVPITCKAYIEAVGEEEASQNPIGSGPYQVVDRRTGDYIKYEAIEDHWRVVPEFKYLILQMVPEESTRVAMLKTGDIDATVISPNSLSDIADESFITVDTWYYGCNSDIVFGGMCRPGTPNYEEGYHNQDPWVDIRVREAMNIAIDRDAINQALHLGTAEPGRLVVQWEPGWYDVDPIPYDPERASQLLEEAAADGVFTPNAQGGFDFTLVSSPFHPGVPMIAKEAEAVVGYWAEIGIDAEIAPIDFGAYWSSVAEIRTAGECYTYRMTYGETTTYLGQLNPMDVQLGPVWQVPEIDTLAPMGIAALAELDLDKRDEMIREITEVSRDSWLGIPLMRTPFLIAKNNTKVGDWTPNSSSYYFNFEYIRHAEPLNTFRLFEVED
jgi:peptide/nickel transport system substrate-binding protein